MLFDIIMTRFEPNYNPNIIYDASCKVKEYGLNRELLHFMNIQITDRLITDRFHKYESRVIYEVLNLFHNVSKFKVK